MYKTSPQDFALFKATFEEWRFRLGLAGWLVDFKHSILGDESVAQVDADIQSRSACVTLSTIWQDRKDVKREVKLSAVHEVMHLLLAELAALASHRFVNQDELARAEEAIVCSLENWVRDSGQIGR